MKLPSEFAEEIAKILGWKVDQVNETFEIEEDKQGFFVAKLKPKHFLENLQFRTMCALVRDLGGEGYLQGMKAWKVPGPYAKKSKPADTPSKPLPVSGVAPDSLTYDKSKPPDIPNIKFIPIEAIKIPDFLPTRTLISHERLSEITNSIKKHGLKYPIKVRRANSDYELIDGYLRLKSVQQLGWKGILAEIKDATDQEVVVESLITNKHRIEEDPITVAKKLDILVNAFGYTQEKLAEELGIDRTTVAHFIRLLKLPKEIQHSVALHNVSFYHALLLLTVENPDLQVQLAKEIVDNGLSTRQLEERIREFKPAPAPSPEPVAPSPPEPPAPSQPSEPSTEARRAVQPEVTASTSPSAQEYMEPEPSTGYPPLPSEPTTAAPPKEEPVEPPEPKPEPIDIGEFECPECHAHFLVEHVNNNLHRLRRVKTVES
jgi:ParB family chromosome partitioning protein